MKKSIILSLIAFLGISLYAFDYQTVYSHNTTLFEEKENNSVVGMRIDSVKFIEGDSVFYPLKSIRNTDYYRFTPLGASWLGEKIVINENYNYFFNKDGDSIRIKTSAEIGESWIVYQKDDVVITGKVEKIENESFLGISDFCKYISLSVSGTPSFPLKNPIVISKNFGFTKTGDYYYFPNLRSDGYSFADYPMEILELVGMAAPKVGLQNLTWFEVFDFQPNDEVHIKFETNCLRPDCGSDSKQLRETIIKYLSRADYPDSIVYQRSVISRQNNVTAESTGKQVVKKNKSFNKLPRESIIEFRYCDNSICSGNAYQLSMSQGNKFLLNNSELWNSVKIDNSLIEIISGGVDLSYWMSSISDGCFPADVYIKGLGGPYAACDDTFGFSGTSISEWPVYYKKGDYSWGTPFVLTAVENPKVKFGKISSNPVKNELKITLSETASVLQVNLYDFLGRSVQTFHFREVEEVNLEMGKMNVGIYFVQWIADGKSETHKIIKE